MLLAELYQCHGVDPCLQNLNVPIISEYRLTSIVRFTVEDACAPGLDPITVTGREAEASWLALQVNGLPSLTGTAARDRIAGPLLGEQWGEICMRSAPAYRRLEWHVQNPRVDYPFLSAVPPNGYLVTLHSRDACSLVASEVRCYRAPAGGPRFVDRGV